MMPRLLSLVLRRSGGGAVLLALIVVVLAVPARQVLLEAWPDRVDEVLAEAGPGRIERRFLPSDSREPVDAFVVARSRPITLWRIETESGEFLHAWLAGVRDTDGGLLPALPAWLEPVRLDGPLPDAVRLVLTTASRDKREVDGAVIARMYRPNDMGFADRVSLWSGRLAERWRWPLRATADARMTPPPR
ncbi:hypothetical protein [Wenzhouxiangella sediminis]|uniref:Uncharacterized protein n=1 Tax=Wenzhouxiangella sediminis TaxID=1792836 RepID=A0A3E1K8N5_9GAMM|nr:hypothetical protein [Wenzhouxiangella sediminis]RFF30061.1 hypothetical protein DZC52_09605 [Wenzhouxiangella sediminis]